jgi:hypothetical protein
MNAPDSNKTLGRVAVAAVEWGDRKLARPLQGRITPVADKWLARRSMD